MLFYPSMFADPFQCPRRPAPSPLAPAPSPSLFRALLGTFSSQLRKALRTHFPSLISLLIWHRPSQLSPLRFPFYSSLFLCCKARIITFFIFVSISVSTHFTNASFYVFRSLFLLLSFPIFHQDVSLSFGAAPADSCSRRLDSNPIPLLTHISSTI